MASGPPTATAAVQQSPAQQESLSLATVTGNEAMQTTTTVTRDAALHKIGGVPEADAQVHGQVAHWLSHLPPETSWVVPKYITTRPTVPSLLFA
jgi:hypothetical protein